MFGLNKFIVASMLSFGVISVAISATQFEGHIDAKSAHHGSFHHDSVAFQLLNPKSINKELTLNNEQKLLFKDALDFHKAMTKELKEKSEANRQSQLTLISSNTPNLEAVFSADNLVMEEFLLKTKEYQSRLLKFWNSLDKSQKDKLVSAYQNKINNRVKPITFESTIVMPATDSQLLALEGQDSLMDRAKKQDEELEELNAPIDKYNAQLDETNKHLDKKIEAIDTDPEKYTQDMLKAMGVPPESMLHVDKVPENMRPTSAQPATVAPSTATPTYTQPSYISPSPVQPTNVQPSAQYQPPVQSQPAPVTQPPAQSQPAPSPASQPVAQPQTIAPQSPAQYKQAPVTQPPAQAQPALAPQPTVVDPGDEALQMIYQDSYNPEGNEKLMEHSNKVMSDFEKLEKQLEEDEKKAQQYK